MALNALINDHLHLFRFFDHEIPVMGEKNNLNVLFNFVYLTRINFLHVYMQDICSSSIQEREAE